MFFTFGDDADRNCTGFLSYARSPRRKFLSNPISCPTYQKPLHKGTDVEDSRVEVSGRVYNGKDDVQRKMQYHPDHEHDLDYCRLRSHEHLRYQRPETTENGGNKSDPEFFSPINAHLKSSASLQS